MYDFNGKVAIVTGARSGIGREIALRLASEGADIALFNRAANPGEVPASLKSLQDELIAAGCNAKVYLTDVSDPKQIQDSVENVITDFGHVDFLVNSAGTNIRETFMDIQPNSWDKIFAINLKGTFFMCQAVAKHFMQQKSGRIVNIASIGALRAPNKTSIPYASSKAGVLQLTMSLAAELGPYNVTVNAINPGNIWTPMWEAADKVGFALKWPDQEYVYRKYFDSVIKDTTLTGKATETKDIASGVAFLLSDQAACITGQHINIDSGTCFN